MTSTPERIAASVSASACGEPGHGGLVAADLRDREALRPDGLQVARLVEQPVLAHHVEERVVADRPLELMPSGEPVEVGAVLARREPDQVGGAEDEHVADDLHDCNGDQGGRQLCVAQLIHRRASGSRKALRVPCLREAVIPGRPRPRPAAGAVDHGRLGGGRRRARRRWRGRGRGHLRRPDGQCRRGSRRPHRGADPRTPARACSRPPSRPPTAGARVPAQPPVVTGGS